jgi:hypothetical protein
MQHQMCVPHLFAWDSRTCEATSMRMVAMKLSKVLLVPCAHAPYYLLSTGAMTRVIATGIEARIKSDGHEFVTTKPGGFPVYLRTIAGKPAGMQQTWAEPGRAC